MKYTETHVRVMADLKGCTAPAVDFDIARRSGLPILYVRQALDQLQVEDCVNRHLAGNEPVYTLNRTGRRALDAQPAPEHMPPTEAAIASQSAAKPQESTKMNDGHITTRQGTPGVTRARIAAILEKNPDATFQDLIKETGLTGGTIGYHLKVLRSKKSTQPPRITATYIPKAEKPSDVFDSLTYEQAARGRQELKVGVATFAFWSSGELQICKGEGGIRLDPRDRDELRKFLQLLPELRA